MSTSMHSGGHEEKTRTLREEKLAELESTVSEAELREVTALTTAYR